MRPIPAVAPLPLVIADLKIEAPVRICKLGELTHSPACLRPLAEHQPEFSVELARRSYVVTLRFPPGPFGPVGPRHPKAFIGPDRLTVGLRPDINLSTYPGHPHLNGDSSACPLPPHDTDWKWGPGAVLDYLDQIAIFIVKTESWAVSGGERGGVWLGPAVGHQPDSVLATIAPTAPCRCGSGATYRSCHAPVDITAAS